MASRVVVVIKSVPETKHAFLTSKASCFALGTDCTIDHYHCDTMSDYYDTTKLKQHIDSLKIKNDSDTIVLIIEAGTVILNTDHVRQALRDLKSVGYATEQVNDTLISRVVLFRYSSNLSYYGYSKIKIYPKQPSIQYFNSFIVRWQPAVFELLRNEARTYLWSRISPKRGLSVSAPEFRPSMHLYPIRRSLTPELSQKFTSIFNREITTFDLLYYFFLTEGTDLTILERALTKTQSRRYQDRIVFFQAKATAPSSLNIDRLKESLFPTAESYYLLYQVTKMPIYLYSAYSLSIRTFRDVKHLFVSLTTVNIQITQSMSEDPCNLKRVVENLIFDPIPLRSPLLPSFSLLQSRYAITPEMTRRIPQKEIIAYFALGDGEAFLYKTDSASALVYTLAGQDRQIETEITQRPLIAYHGFLYVCGDRTMDLYNLEDGVSTDPPTLRRVVSLSLPETRGRKIPCNHSYYLDNERYDLQTNNRERIGKQNRDFTNFYVIAAHYPYLLLRCRYSSLYRLYNDRTLCVSPPAILLINEENDPSAVRGIYVNNDVVEIATANSILRCSLKAFHL